VPVRIAHIAGWEWQVAGGALREALLTEVSRLGAAAWDALIPCSHATARQGIERGIGSPEQYHPVWPPVDLQQFRPDGREQARAQVRAEWGMRDDDLAIISVLRLAPQKAPLDLIAAADLVMADSARARLVLVGGGPMQEQVESEIARRGMADRVLMLGPRRDLPRLLKAADVFALLSVWEPFGMVFAEAAAVGLPSVGTRVDGIPEAVAEGRSGLLVEPGDLQGAAAAILRIGSDPELARRLGEGGIEHARAFSAERFIAETAAVYERCLAAEGIG
ncbi:MAG TPA: glycosyltransferase family 4 protein, partial [Armatimonadota bacterium]|nr:glycosyltransferase family 4 protein [Armatimonadota bacterium]